MKKISNSTFFYKKVFPVYWFGFLIFMLGIMTNTVLKNGQKLPLITLIIPIAMMAFGFVLMKVLIFDLADEVFDEGDHLLVKFGKREEKIYLSNIKHLNMTIMTNPKRITLTLREPCAFGTKVSFSPITPFSFNPVKPNPIAEELIERIDQSRA